MGKYPAAEALSRRSLRILESSGKTKHKKNKTILQGRKVG
jgi:hypothetical protein